MHFPQDEVGKTRKLARPWHGPYRVLRNEIPDVTCVKVYFPQHGAVHIHQSRVCCCPSEFPAGYFWYGGRRKGPGRPPKWGDTLLDSGLMPTCISSTTDQVGVPPEDESRGEESNETEMLGILQPPGVEEFLSSAPEAPDLTGAPVPDLGSAPLFDSEGADPI